MASVKAKQTPLERAKATLEKLSARASKKAELAEVREQIAALRGKPAKKIQKAK